MEQPHAILVSAASSVEQVALMRKASELARSLHDGQVDKAGKPYYEHVAHVAAITYVRVGDYRAYIIGMLHDVFEDCAYSSTQMRETFGDEITDAVWLLTRHSHREQSYDEYITLIATSKSYLAIEVKISDLMHNTDPRRITAAIKHGSHVPSAGKYLKAIQTLTVARTFCIV